MIKRRAESSHAAKGRSNETRAGSLKSDLSKNLQVLTGDPMDILVEVIKGIGDFDFSDNVFPQMMDLAKSTAVNLAQTIATSVHPVLGAVFSIFASVFNLAGAPESDMSKKILEQVDKMIKGSLRDFRYELIEDELSGVMESINSAGTNATDWGNVKSSLGRSFPTVFRYCWDSPDTEECTKWRTGLAVRAGGEEEVVAKAGASLVMEIQFTALMITSAAEVARFHHEFLSFAKQILQAASRSRQHFRVFNEIRSNFRSPETGLSKGEVVCPSAVARRKATAGKMPDAYCKATVSRDHFLDKDFCDFRKTRMERPSRDFCKKRGILGLRKPDCSEAIESRQSALDSCYKAYKQEINGELQKLSEQTKAAMMTAQKMWQSQGGVSKKRKVT